MRSLEPRAGLVRCGLTCASATPHGTGARLGCERWEREPGIDDDDWDPPGTPTIAPYVAEPPPTPRVPTGRDGWWTEPPRPRRPVVALVREPAVIALLARDPFGGLFNWQDD